MTPAWDRQEAPRAARGGLPAGKALTKVRRHILRLLYCAGGWFLGVWRATVGLIHEQKGPRNNRDIVEGFLPIQKYPSPKTPNELMDAEKCVSSVFGLI